MKKIKIEKKMEEEVELSECFNCEAVEEPEVERQINIDGPDKYTVYCFSCGCSGPHMLTPKEAVKWWNALGMVGNAMRMAEKMGASLTGVAPPMTESTEPPGAEGRSRGLDHGPMIGEPTC